MHNDTQIFRRLGALAALLATAVVANAQGRGPATVQVDLVQATRLAPTVDVPGTILSRDDARLSAEVDGRLDMIAEVGTRAEKGDVLATIVNDVLTEQQDEFGGLVQREISLIAFLDNEVERLRKLARANNAARSQLEQTESDLAVARDNLRIARSRLQQTQVRIDALSLVAPFPGVVTERLRNPGERIGVNEAMLRLVNPARLEVVARAPLASVALLTEGSEVIVRSQRGSGAATVRTVVPFGDARTHMYELRATLTDPDSWFVGESVRAGIPTAAATEVLAVPRDALVLRREGAAVFRINAEDIAERVPVTVGTAQGDLIAVTGNLNAGERVVVRGAELLRDGANVAVQSGGATGAGGAAGTR
ncbi:MAG: efflux RND transporter periplasmic adaptor subunit [Pseudomonadota bacterium]